MDINKFNASMQKIEKYIDVCKNYGLDDLAAEFLEKYNYYKELFTNNLENWDIKSLLSEDLLIIETKFITEMFMRYNFSDKDFENNFGIPHNTVCNRLTKEEKFLRAYPKNGRDLFKIISEKRKSNRQAGNRKGGLTATLRHGFSKNESGEFKGPIVKFKLEDFYQNIEYQHDFLKHIMLYFRLRIESVTDLFKMTSEEVSNIIYEDDLYEDAFDYLFNEDKTNQEEAKGKFVKYYSSYFNAKSSNNLILVEELKNMVSDKKALDLSNNNYLIDLRNNEIMKVLVTYQLKYALNSEVMSEIFNINKGVYEKRAYEYSFNNGLGFEYSNLVSYIDSKGLKHE